MRSSLHILRAALLLALTAGELGRAGKTVAPTWWRPQRGVVWNYQLSDTGSISVIPGVSVYIIDVETAAGAGGATLRKAVPGVRIVCYFSAGSWEKFRVAADRRRGIKPADWAGLLGKVMDGWPDERWVDVRSPRLRAIMQKRLRFARDAGCDGVDPDNVNGFENPTGFPLTRSDQLQFNRWLADASHALGLAVGLKNAPSLLPVLEPRFDFFVIESCFSYGECGPYNKVAAKKPVFGVQYCDVAVNLEDGSSVTDDPACYCARANARGWSFLIKHLDLGPPAVSCQTYCQQHSCGSGRAKGYCRAQVDNNCAAVFGSSNR